MEFLVFASTTTGNAVVLPAAMSMVIARKNGTVVYAIGGSGKDRMVWEVAGTDKIEVVHSYAEALKKAGTLGAAAKAGAAASDTPKE